MKRGIISFVIIFFMVPGQKADFCPGFGWTKYDDRCIKLVETISSHREASEVCPREFNPADVESPRLLEIRSEEDQEFVSHLFFNKSATPVSVWLGGVRDLMSDQFIWASDNSPINYTNWAENSPTNNSERGCVELHSEISRSIELGQWRDVTCSKGNWVACQKVAPLSVPEMTMAITNILRWKSNFLNGNDVDIDAILHSIAELGNKFNTLKTDQANLNAKHQLLEAKQISLDAKQIILDTTQQELGEKQQALDTKQITLDTKQQVLDSKQQTLDAKQQALDAKQISLDNKQKTLETDQAALKSKQQALDSKQIAQESKLTSLQSQQTSFQTSFNTLDTKASSLETKQNSMQATQTQMQTNYNTLQTNHNSLKTEVSTKVIPVGYIFVQLPSQSEPRVLWPSYSWIEVSSTYAGHFFRVVGGDAEPFGLPYSQKDAFQGHQHGGAYTSRQRSGTDHTNDKSQVDELYTGNTNSISSDSRYGTVRVSSETRPINYSVRIWRRSA